MRLPLRLLGVGRFNSRSDHVVSAFGLSFVWWIVGKSKTESALFAGSEIARACGFLPHHSAASRLGAPNAADMAVRAQTAGALEALLGALARLGPPEAYLSAAGQAQVILQDHGRRYFGALRAQALAEVLEPFPAEWNVQLAAFTIMK